MSRIILAFLVVFGLYYFDIDAWRHLTGLEKWNLTKLVAYSTICALLTVATLALIVITF